MRIELTRDRFADGRVPISPAARTTMLMTAPKVGGGSLILAEAGGFAPHPARGPAAFEAVLSARSVQLPDGKGLKERDGGPAGGTRTRYSMLHMHVARRLCLQPAEYWEMWLGWQESNLHFLVQSQAAYR